LATNPIPIKGAMKMLGRDTGEVRLPMTALSPAEESRMRETLKKYGLI
jgi:4-hydroxy-tetrahydrodipicolinate synthase